MHYADTKKMIIISNRYQIFKKKKRRNLKGTTVILCDSKIVKFEKLQKSISICMCLYLFIL